MLSDKAIVRNLVEICATKGLEYVVISPGSRNAPLIISFNEQGSFNCLSIPDERVAGYFAMGIAQQTRKPVIITCTSGTAALNFAPAIAEAFYQHIPLLIITADRPVEWIHQGEGQSINQREVFANYVLKSYQLPQDSNDKDAVWSANRMVSEAIDNCYQKGGGPVHINIPFREPLYGQKSYTGVPLPKVVETLATVKTLPTFLLKQLQKVWEQHPKKMVLCGLLPKWENLSTLIQQLSQDPAVIVLSETTSNIIHDDFICPIDGVLTMISSEEMVAFQPDLLVTIGGSFVSKKLKQFLRKCAPKEHWHIGEEGYDLDTFQSLTKRIPMPTEAFFTPFINTNFVEKKDSDFRQLWEDKKMLVRAHHQQFLSTIDWCDLKAFELILAALPLNTNLQMGNSTPIRYVQLFEPKSTILYNANRGVAGIDGSTSTAAGAALVNGQLTTIITGDIAFFYDSNAFWHHHLSPNLRVILINNGGGNIFRYIPGPPTTKQLETYFEAQHDLNAAHIAQTFNIVYYFAEDAIALQKMLPSFFQTQQEERPALLEIKTDGDYSAEVLRAYFKSMT